MGYDTVLSNPHRNPLLKVVMSQTKISASEGPALPLACVPQELCPAGGVGVGDDFVPLSFSSPLADLALPRKLASTGHSVREATKATTVLF